MTKEEIDLMLWNLVGQNRPAAVRVLYWRMVKMPKTPPYKPRQRAATVQKKPLALQDFRSTSLPHYG